MPTCPIEGLPDTIIVRYLPSYAGSPKYVTEAGQPGTSVRRHVWVPALYVGIVVSDAELRF